MVNRNILDQNGFNSRNILNIRNQKLKDGKAIKINTSITNKNEIDLNMKTNTTEQTTVGDTDLFLLSDTTGSTIKYITGINLKQKALLHLVGGTNINLTTDAQGDTEINLDDNIDTAGSITCKDFVKIKNTNNAVSSFGGILSLEGSVPQISYPFRYKQQIFHTNSGDAYQILAEDNALNQRVLFELHSGTNNTTTHTVNFHTANLTNILKINTYDANVLELNNNNQQYLIKDTGKNFVNNDILSVDINNKISPITPTDIISNIVAGTNLNRNVNTINLNTTLTGITNINSTTIATKLDISAHPTIDTLGGVLKLLKPTKTNPDGSINIYNRDFEILTDLQNNDNNGVLVFRALKPIPALPDYDILSMGSFSGSNQIRANTKMIIQPLVDDYTDDEFMLNIKSFVDKSCKVCIQSDIVNTFVSKETSLIFKNHFIQADIGLNVNNKLYLHHPSTNTNQSRVEFFLGSAIKDSNSLIFELTPNLANMYKPLYMNDNQINFQTNNTNHFIKMNNGTDFNGLEYAGGGSGSQVAHYFKSTNGSGTDLMKMYEAKVEILRPLYMNSTGASGSSTDRPIYLHTNEAFYIKYLSDGTINGTDIAGFDGVRLSNTSTQSTNKINLQTYDTHPTTGQTAGHTNIFNTLAVIRGNTSLQNDINDTFAVKCDGFCKAIIHSDNNDVELALKCGSSNSNQAVIKRQTNNRFLINNNGEFRVEVSNNTCNFVNNNGRLAWQNDRNLVIYDTGGNAVFASDTDISERRFKDNIVSLDLENSYNIIKLLNPVSFVYKEDPNTPKKGFIVDEVEDKIPECIRELTNCDCEDKSSKLLYKEDIVPDLVASVKYLINKVETQETTISNLNQYLLNEISTLKEQLITQSTLISNLQSQINNI